MKRRLRQAAGWAILASVWFVPLVIMHGVLMTLVLTAVTLAFVGLVMLAVCLIDS